ncbi:hypothetical protein QUB37_21950 [Microcoleus sp. AT3-A2]|uniref:hypothetical protein n=1 Tax=unclassified Microcoleus TaxID=2642155 RepID=UPI002FCE8F9A
MQKRKIGFFSILPIVRVALRRVGAKCSGDILWINPQVFSLVGFTTTTEFIETKGILLPKSGNWLAQKMVSAFVNT